MLHYRMSGLDNVYLINGYDTEVMDGEEYVTIHDPDDLHAKIAHFLATKPDPLTGKELRFLRKMLDLSQEQLARHLGYERLQVVRWEKGNPAVPRVADLAVRAMYLHQLRDALKGQ